MKTQYTFKARQDLQDIYAYIAFTLLSPEAARGTVGRIMDAVGALASLPERNPLYKDEPWRSLGVRFLPVRNYLVFYTMNRQDDIVTILRILYGGRDLARQLEEIEET